MPSPLNQRAITGELQAPPQLAIQNTALDTFTRPRQNQAGGDLMQLGNALAQLNPGLGAILGKYQEAQDQQTKSADLAQGSSERERIRDAVEAQKYLQENRGTWSPERLQGFEMSDAQIHANMYPGAIRQKLEETGLWNNEKANPQDIQNAISEVRSQFMQRGEGSDPVWQRTFDQYRQGFENGITNQWVERTGHIREDKVERMVADDLTSQLLSHQQLPTVDEVVKGFNSYAEKSFTNISMYPSQVNQAKVKAFLAAHSSALNSGDPALAERIMAAFDQIPTKDDNGKLQYLSKTEYGGNALAKMHQDTYFANRQAKAETQEKKDELKSDTLGQLFTIKEQFRGLLPSQIPPILPDTKLRESMETLGMNPDAIWDTFRQSRLTTYNQVRAEDSRAAEDSTEMLETKLRNVETKSQLNEIQDQLHTMDSDPTFNNAAARSRLNNLIGAFQSQQKRFEETGKLGSPAFRVVNQEVKNFGTLQATIATNILKKFDKDTNTDLLSKFKLAPALDPETGQLSYGFDDLNRQMQSDFLKEADAQGGEDPWDKVKIDTLRKASGTIIEKYRPLFEERVKQIGESIKEDKRLHDEAANRTDDVVPSSVPGWGDVPRVGTSGLPTGVALKNVEKATSSLQWLKGQISMMSSNDPDRQAVQWVHEAADVLKDDSLTRSWLDKGSPNLSPTQSAERASRNIRLAWFGAKDNPYRTNRTIEDGKPGEEINFDKVNNRMPALTGLLTRLEGNADLQKAINETMVSGKMSELAPASQQILYADARSAFVEGARTFGIPTELSTSDKPPFKPEWIDPTVVPMFDYVGELKEDNTENIKKAMKNAGLNPGDVKEFATFVLTQRHLVQQKAKTYGLPLAQQPSK